MPNHPALLKPNPAWSLMRCIFAFEICLIHVCSLPWYQPQEGWMAETVFMSVTRAGTVGFLMLAGAILIGRGESSPVSYLVHRLRRWLPLIALAQLLYLAFHLWTGEAVLGDLTWSNAVEPAWYHIWFFYALGSIYLVVVPMRWFAARLARLPLQLRLAALAAGRRSSCCWLGWTTTVRGGSWGDLRPFNLLTYCGYAWTGYVLAVTWPRGAAAGWWLVLAGVASAVLATTLASDAAGHPVGYYFHRCSAFVAMAAIGQFLLLLRFDIRSWRAASIERINRLSRLTLGIFVVHPLVIALAGWPYGWALADSVEWVSMPVAGAVLFAISAAITWLALHLLAALRQGGRVLTVLRPA